METTLVTRSSRAITPASAIRNSSAGTSARKK
jgi:hypothetical protein